MTIGVVLPVYNVEVLYIYECMQAIEQQIHRDFKLIIVLDGANQQTVEHVYKAVDILTIPYRIINREKNMGIAFSLDEGFSYLTDCPYLTWISIDNRQDPSFLSTFSEYIQKTTEDVVLLYSYYLPINQDGIKFVDEDNWYTIMEKLMNKEKSSILSLSFIGASFIFKRDAYERAGGYSTQFGVVSDYEFWIRLLDQGEIQLIPKSLMEYRLNGKFSLTTLTGQQDLYLQAMKASLHHRRLKQDIPDVTVIITAKNHEEYIEQCIQSVLNQSHQNIHIVVIDVGSTDGTLQKITSFSDSRIIPIHVSARVKAEALNIGLEYVLGKYVLELDGDDWLDNKAVEIMHQQFNSINQNVGLLYANRKLWYQTESGLEEGPIVKGIKYKDKYDVMEKFATHCPRMYRMSTLEQLGGWKAELNGEPLLADDYMMFLKLASVCEFSWIDVPLYHQRRHSNNITSTDQQTLNYQFKAVVQNQLQEWGNNSMVVRFIESNGNIIGLELM
ncbi:glycosyltransferase [Terribacillus sp. DMT04]|uniref:glycosyltransferase family 2 protein n=1 Tax=Terribacillus sp. DMT04 TaxID=2850441 RepID=UPI001C2C9C8C|nr:glycosyltransferase [Terribacillus sp. DMT04]QXE03588.1 glycosyltransferase [Terribacillus sp. DMT04]